MATTAKNRSEWTVDLVTAANWLGICRTKAYDLARKGTFPVPLTKVGDRFRVHVTAVEALVTTPSIPTVGEWMQSWLKRRRAIRKSTRRSYAGHLARYILPHLGTIPLDQLTPDDIGDMFDAIEQCNCHIRAWRAAGDIRAVGQRTLAPATLHRIRATLRAGLNTAIPKHLLYNPARHIELTPQKRPRGLFWTADHVARWKTTGKIPSPVMVWTPQQAGLFLDSIVGDPWYPIYHLIAYTGLRRGEACGLHWTEVNLEDASLLVLWQIVQLGWETELSEPKGSDPDTGTPIAIDRRTVKVLTSQRRTQERRRKRAPFWHDTGLVFTEPDGSPIHPARVTRRFHELTAQCGLPPIRLHDLRHLHASLGFAAGVPSKIMKERLRHTDEAFTQRIYTHIPPELHRKAATAIQATIPRQRHGA